MYTRILVLGEAGVPCRLEHAVHDDPHAAIVATAPWKVLQACAIPVLVVR